MAGGKRGYRLRTIKLRGCISQGLLLPLQDGFPKIVGEDVTDRLGVTLYQAQIPAKLSGHVKGLLPSFIKKTDEERIQNLTDQLKSFNGREFMVTEKLDGTSFTAYINKGSFGICGRNYEFQIEGSNKNTYINTAEELGLKQRLTSLGRNIAIQGEMIGEGIQGNPYKIPGHTIKFFTVFDIDKYKPLAPNEAHEILTGIGLKPVPVVKNKMVFNFDIDNILKFAEGRSMLSGIEREGLVFRAVDDSSVSFKVISNIFLLKERGKNE